MFLEIRNIKKSFGTGDSKVDVLKGLDLDIEKGEFCVLLGPSGSGKYCQCRRSDAGSSQYSFVGIGAQAGAGLGLTDS